VLADEAFVADHDVLSLARRHGYRWPGRPPPPRRRAPGTDVTWSCTRCARARRPPSPRRRCRWDGVRPQDRAGLDVGELSPDEPPVRNLGVGREVGALPNHTPSRPRSPASPSACVRRDVLRAHAGTPRRADIFPVAVDSRWPKTCCVLISLGGDVAGECRRPRLPDVVEDLGLEHVRC